MIVRSVLAASLALGACSTSMPDSPSSRAPASPAPPGWRQHDVSRPQPPRVEPADDAGVAPSDAVVLIGADGTGLTNWETPGGDAAPWRVEDGALEVVPGTGAIQSRESFGDVQVHIEWMPAAEPEKTSQDRSNSGLFLVDGRYEVQILDVWENRTYADGRAAAIYGQFPPLADATRPPTEWQSYDVFFRMPRFAPDGTVLEVARMTVVHNGVLVQNNEALPGMTTWIESLRYEAHGPGRIQLQDHGSPVRFRNLWVRRIPERVAPPAGYDLEAVALTDAQAARLVGTYDRQGGGQFVIERDGSEFSMPWGARSLRLVPLSPTTLHLVNTDGILEVDIGADGQATGLTFTMGGGTYPATRVQ